MSDKLYRITWLRDFDGIVTDRRVSVKGFWVGEIYLERTLAQYNDKEIGRELVGQGPSDLGKIERPEDMIDRVKEIRNWINSPVAQSLDWGRLRTVGVGGPNMRSECCTDGGGIAASGLVLPLVYDLVDAAVKLGWTGPAPASDRLGKGDVLIVLNKIEDWAAKAIAPPEAESEGEQPNVEQEMERVALAVGDDTAAKIMAIGQRKDWGGEQKMQEILRLDKRFAGKDSVEWGTLVGVSAAAIRGYRTWKLLQTNKGDE
jgi:hypothetical protein